MKEDVCEHYISKGKRCLHAKWKVYGSLEQAEIASTGGNEDNLKVKTVFEPFQPSSILHSEPFPGNPTTVGCFASFDAVCIGDGGSGGRDKGGEDGR